MDKPLEKPKEAIAFLVSRLFGPESIMPLSLWFVISFMGDFDWREDPLLLAITAFFFLIAPILIFLIFYFLGYLTDIDATERKQRPPVLIAKQISLSIGLFFVWMRAPGLTVQLYTWWYLITLSILLISFIWKISIHMTAASMLFWAVYLIFGSSMLAVFILLLPIAWARLTLKKHEPLQLAFGAVLPLILWGIVSLTLG
ncbi:hypothetical protein KC571_02360 [candidate division WWE3 bacterium]|uniref:Uncharacterized protein n=1 Tax=candidate division WWE3 bacterium TaxID=2053526 RepID=A0A955RQ52_UNCKA|nr:hypothetical protein [candidate division WWE3 bacterium]